MKASFILFWLWLNVRRIRFGLFRHPVFTVQLLWKRIGLLFFRRFVGDSIRSPITGELIFNDQSLVSYWAFHCIKELGTDWERVVRETAAPVVLDVGSNLGQFRALVMALNPGARITTVDAWPEMEAYVPTFGHHKVAVGDFYGTTRLRRSKSGLTASTSEGYYDGEGAVVPVRKLDEIWNCKPVDVLKIDIDGAELEALKGATNLIRNTRVIIIETSKLEEVKRLCPGRKWSTVNNCDWIGVRE